MNKEKMIAGIEKYVETLSSTEQKQYAKALSDFTLKENNDAKEIYPVIGLACIVQELQAEIKEQATKETKGNSFVKRSKLITKLLNKCYREDLRKGFYEEINGEKLKCCIIDGFYAFMLKDVDIPMIADEEKPQFTVKRFLPDLKNCDVCEFDIAEIKTQLKMHKAKKNKTKCVTELNGKWYDTGYFINVVDGLGGEVKMYKNGNPLAPDLFESENGKAILMPCRKPNI